MDRWQTTMMAVVSMALLASIITISSPTPTLAHGHWNPDGDFNLQPESDLDSDEMQIRTLSADKLLSAESASNTEEGQQPSETIQMISISEEVCGDGIDNDGDTLVDISDEQCSVMTQQQQPILQQEPVVVSSAEICDDNLDNDFDGKVDSRDEECSYITSSTSAFPTPGQAEPVTDDDTERGDEEDEQESDEDLNEEPGGNENSDGEADKDNDSNDDEQDEDEEDEQQSDDEGNGDDEDDDDGQDDS